MDLKEAISSQPSVNEEQFESAYDGLRKEGKLEGKIEGKIEAQTETIQNGHKIGLSPSTLAELTSLPLEEVRAIIDELQAK